MDIILPSVLDPEMAPPGKHVMSCFVQYAPYDLKGGWNNEKREAFGDAVVNTLAQYAPNIKDIILHRQVLSPMDLENTFGLTEGNIFHGELTIQQLFSLRPAVKWANYTSPIKNYFQKLIGIKGLEYPIIEKSIIKSRELPGVELETTIKAGEESGTSSQQHKAEHH